MFGTWSCPARSVVCQECERVGHFARWCMSKSARVQECGPSFRKPLAQPHLLPRGNDKRKDLRKVPSHFEAAPMYLCTYAASTVLGSQPGALGSRLYVESVCVKGTQLDLAID